jgi:DNA-binding NarL/FixJ family response regulator
MCESPSDAKNSLPEADESAASSGTSAGDCGATIFSPRQLDQIFSAGGIAVSPRQVEIISLLFEGCGDKQIVARLGISVGTVRTHMARLFGKLKVRDRNELILRLVRLFHAGCKDSGCSHWQ